MEGKVMSQDGECPLAFAVPMNYHVSTLPSPPWLDSGALESEIVLLVTGDENSLNLG